MERLESYQWFRNRVDYRRIRREKLRWGALLFNGLFLLLYFFLAGTPMDGIWMLLVSMFLTPIGFIGLLSCRYAAPDHDELEASMVARGIGGYRWTALDIYRDGVLMGRDRGWVGRDGGLLVFEGRTSRFEVMRDDLVFVPDGSHGEIPGRLTVSADRGTIDLRFQILNYISEDEQRRLFMGWPSAERTLPGPPSIPKLRSFRDRWSMTTKTHEWLLIPFLFLGPSFLVPYEGWGLIAIRLVLLVTGLIATWIAFLTTWRKDDADLARLMERDAERLRAARNVVIDTNDAGTGNPVANAAVG